MADYRGLWMTEDERDELLIEEAITLAVEIHIPQATAAFQELGTAFERLGESFRELGDTFDRMLLEMELTLTPDERDEYNALRLAGEYPLDAIILIEERRDPSARHGAAGSGDLIARMQRSGWPEDVAMMYALTVPSETCWLYPTPVYRG